MSGATSIPLAFAALYLPGTPRKWFAVLAFAGLCVFALQMLRKNYRMAEAAKVYHDQESIIVSLRKQLEPYIKISKPPTPTPMSVFLRDDHQIAKHIGYCNVEVRNNTAAAIRDVKVELLSIYPTPSDLSSIVFPINLSPKDRTRTINPQTSNYFYFLQIEVRPGTRKVILHDENGAIQSFEDDLFRMLSIFNRNGYKLQLVASSCDLPKVEKTCRLILRPEPEDVIGLTSIFPYSVELELE